MSIPVIVSADRAAAARVCSGNDEIYIDYNLAEEEDIDGLEAENNTLNGKCLYRDTHPEFEKRKKITILDDGFSALDLKKDLNIVLIDATTDIFKQDVVPAGILREPLSALKYADIIIVNKCSPEMKRTIGEYMEASIKRYNRSCQVFYSYYKPVRLLTAYKNRAHSDLEILNGKKIVAFCGIGNPGYFYHNLSECGASVSRAFEFEDHHEYTYRDIKGIRFALDEMPGAIAVSTVKDYVKLKKFTGTDNFTAISDRLYFLDFETRIDNTFFELILNSYEKFIEK